ncbi:hypothetical protein ACPWR0_09300 [Pandoraea pneumonica]|uniref:hypothetical protein n=1 Tax=Pandoraea pneumonica TaxID=2508299 RepID=UPI003CE74198
MSSAWQAIGQSWGCNEMSPQNAIELQYGAIIRGEFVFCNSVAKIEQACGNAPQRLPSPMTEPATGCIGHQGLRYCASGAGRVW